MTSHSDHRLSLRVAANPFDYRPLLKRGVREWSSGDDAMIDGEKPPLKALVAVYEEALAMSAIEMLLLCGDDRDLLGFALVSASEGWLEGHLLYVRPNHRGQNVASEHFDHVVNLAASLGLRGFRMRSTSKMWEKIPGFSVEPLLTQLDGKVVYDYRRAA